MKRILVLLLAAACSKSSSQAVPDAGVQSPPVRSCTTTLSFTPSKPIIQAYAAGEWNNFSTTADEMRADGGTYSIDLHLDAGEYAYKLVVDGQYELDPADGWQKYYGGILNSALEVPDCNAPLVSVASWQVTGSSLNATLQITLGANQTTMSTPAITLNGNAMSAPDITATGLATVAASGLANGKHVVSVSYPGAKSLYLPFWVESVPFEWQDATMYFAMVDRFYDGDSTNDAPLANVPTKSNFQGGDFKGLKTKIDSGYFDSLGIRAIWISNPAQQPAEGWPGDPNNTLYAGYHGYWPAAPLSVDPHFGTLADVQAAVQSAHDHGIRVLLDFVANHVHQDHPWWTAHPDWFNPLHLSDGRTCLCEANPGTQYCSYDAPDGLQCWFAPYLPDLNYTDQDTVLAMEQNAIDWMELINADGLRVDAVKQFPHIVGTRLRARLHAELEQSNVPTYMVGETFVGSWSSGGQSLVAQYVSDNELQGQFDFPLFWEIRAAIAEGGSFNNLEAALTSEQGYYGPHALMSPFIGNHDVVRFISDAAGQDTSDGWNNPPPQPTDAAPYVKAQLAFTVLLTVPGLPLVYQGDEIGMAGAGDPDNRRFMQFDGLSQPQQDLLTRVKLLGTLRQQDEALRRGNYLTLLKENDLLVYARQESGQKARVIALDKSGSTQSRSIVLSPDLHIPDGALTDALGGAAANVSSGTLTFTLQPMSAAIYK